MNPFLPAIKRAATSLSAINEYLSAIGTLRVIINKRAKYDEPVTLFDREIRNGGAWILGLLYSFEVAGYGEILVQDSQGSLLLRAPIDSESRYRRWLLQIPHDSKLSISYRRLGGTGSPTFYAGGLSNVHAEPQHDHAQIEDQSICAAIATYPQRKHMLQDAVLSLVDQVDYLFVYLNNYETPPRFLLSRGLEKKVQFIVDTNSRHRAAAKFFWLNMHRCYWLLCDDDIIYPKDYAKRMVKDIDRYNRRAIVGVHGTRFLESGHAHVPLPTYPFQRSLQHDHAVHMLGSGTVAIHSSILSRTSWRRLMRYPISNDEILAVIARTKGFPLVAIARQEYWLKSNPKMTYGIFEETQLEARLARRARKILSWGEPWPEEAQLEKDLEMATRNDICKA